MGSIIGVGSGKFGGLARTIATPVNEFARACAAVAGPATAAFHPKGGYCEVRPMIFWRYGGGRRPRETGGGTDNWVIPDRLDRVRHSERGLAADFADRRRLIDLPTPAEDPPAQQPWPPSSGDEGGGEGNRTPNPRLASPAPKMITGRGWYDPTGWRADPPRDGEPTTRRLSMPTTGPAAPAARRAGAASGRAPQMTRDPIMPNDLSVSETGR